MRRILLSTLFCLFVTISAQADPFTILPNGELVFNTSFTTQGVFTCAQCTGSGTNTIVFGSGGNTLTLTFTGVNTSLQVGGAVVPTTVGNIQVVASGAGFVFPANSQPLMQLAVQFDQSSPTVGTLVRPFISGFGGGTSLDLVPFNSDHIAFPAGPNPFSFTHIVYTFDPFSIPNISGLVAINAELVAVPEPTTLLLFGAGAGMLSLLRKRRLRT